jgi:ankyrin repeat protein
MSRPLPLRANLEWLKKLSKERLETLRATNADAKLSEAQLAVAREYGFSSWRKLNDHISQHREKLDALVPPELLRQAAAEVVAADDPDLAQLLAAVDAGDEAAVIDALKRRPALASAHGPAGQAPIHVAVQRNDPRLAAVLVAYGADVNATFGQSGHNALSWAVTCNAMECARELVTLGAEPDLFCAAGIGLLDHLRNYFDGSGSLIPNASRTGSTRYAPDGSRLPCPPPTARAQISDALYIASRNGHADVVRFLLEKEPDLSARAYCGATPFHWAYFSGSRVVIELLQRAGADATSRDDVLHCTPRAFGIAVSAIWGFDFKVKKLLDLDPSLANAVDSHTSPLHEAARVGHAQIVELLLAHGADPHFRNTAGKTALDLAIAGGDAAVVDLLKPVS